MGTFRPTSFWSTILSKALLLLAFALSGNVVYSQIAQRGAATTASINGATAAMTINKPTGVVAGDVMIASVLQNETDNDNGGLSNVTSTGWTLVDGRTIYSVGTANGDNAWYGTVLYRVADGTEGSSFAFALPNSRADMAIGSIVAFSGATSTGGLKADGTAGGPFDIDPGTLNIANASTATATSVTTSTANSAVIMLSLVSNDRNHSGWAATSPASLTELYDDITTNGDDGAVAAAWANDPTTGATGDGTVTLTGTDRNGAMFLVLRPCGTAGTLSGTQAICGTGTTTLTTDGNSGGAWTSGNTAVATVNSSTGVVTGVSAGTATITYTIAAAGGCSASTATRTVTVTAAPNAGTVSGTQNICAGGTTTFTSNGNTGGAWTSSATGVATVNATTGVVTGAGAGTATITYTVTGTGGCSNATATWQAQPVSNSSDCVN